jgi:hypothetical protein
MVSSVARAESFVFSGDASTCGRALEVMPAAGEVPANLPRIVVIGTAYPRLVNHETGEDVAGAAILSGPPGMLIQLTEPLVVGETYDVVRGDCPEGMPPVASYTAVEAQPLPTTLGMLAVGELRSIYTVPGRRERYYFTEVTLTPDASMAPWLDAYDWWAETDAHRTPERSLRAGLTAQFDVPCVAGGTAVLDLVGHAAVIPGPADLSTPELAATFTCDDDVIVDATTGEPLTPAEIAELEALANTDAHVEFFDAGVAGTDASGPSIDGGSASMPTEPDTNGNCSASPSRSARAPLWLALSMIGCVITRRRVLRERR